MQVINQGNVKMKKETIQYAFIYSVAAIFIVTILSGGGYLFYKKYSDKKTLNKEVQMPDEMRQKYLQRIDEAKAKIKLGNSSQYDLYMELGNIEYSLGKLGDSIDAYEKAGEISPKNYPSFLSLGNIYTDLKWYDKAQEVYLNAMKNSPISSDIYLKLSQIYNIDWEGKKFNSENILVKGLENNPNNPDLLINLAIYYKNIGDKVKAIDYYQKHLIVRPDNEAANVELAELQK